VAPSIVKRELYQDLDVILGIRNDAAHFPGGPLPKK
jgi:hypothetical protein